MIGCSTTSSRPRASRRQIMTPAGAYRAWCRAADCFWPYVGAAPFFGQLTRRPSPGPLARGERLVGETILPLLEPTERTAILLDLPPAIGLATTLAFQRAGWLVIPVILRWPAPRAILPSDALLAQLVWLAPRLHRPVDPIGVVFVLDGERAGPPLPRGPGARFDNRYVYAPHVFPPMDAFRDWRITRLSVAGTSRAPAGDLGEVIAGARRAGIAGNALWVGEVASFPGDRV